METIKKSVSVEDRLNKLHFNFTLTPGNAKDLSAVYKLKDEYGLASVRLNLAQNWNEDQKNSIDFNSDLVSIAQKFKTDMKGVPNWKYDQCFWPHRGLTVDVFGNESTREIWPYRVFRLPVPVNDLVIADGSGAGLFDITIS